VASLAHPLKFKSSKIPWRSFFWPGFFLVLWEILLRAENPDLMSDDSGEMIAGSWTLGLPHPPGYPLFDLLGRLFSFVPVGSIAFRYNLFSALLGLGAVLFTAKTALLLAQARKGVSKPAWGAPGLALATGLFLFFDRSFFAQALSAKGIVYTLTLLLTSFWAWWRVRHGKKGLSESEGYFLFFTWAVGLTNHWQTVILFIPFLGLWFWVSRWTGSVKKLGWAFTVLVIGISPYLYLPLRAKQAPFPCWGNPITLKEFFWVVSRGLVKGTESYFHPVIFYEGSLHEVGRVLWFYWFPGFFLLACSGIYFIFRERPGWGYSFLLLYFPVLTAVASVHEPRSVDYLLNVYLVPVSSIWALFGFWGFLILFEKVPRIYGGRVWKAIFILLGIAIGFWGFSVFHLENKRFYTFAGDFGKNVLKLTPRNAVLIAGTDHYVMPLFYDRFVLGLRRDVLVTPDVFLVHGWGWDQIAEARPGWGADWKKEKFLVGRWGWLLQKGDHEGGIYYALGPRDLEPILSQIQGDWVPAGAATRWIPRSERFQFSFPAINRELELERTRGLSAYWDFDGRDFSSTRIFGDYGEQFFKVGDWARDQGRPLEAIPWLDKGLCFYPMDMAACNELADFMNQRGDWELAIVLLRHAVEFNPSSVSGWFNLTRLYEREGFVRQADGSYQVLSSLVGNESDVLKPLNLESFLLEKSPVPRVPHSSIYYAQRAKSYEVLGLTYLAQKALETSEILSRDPTGAAL
jgi:tetratricopeptide (TPR) repeat protein